MDEEEVLGADDTDDTGTGALSAIASQLQDAFDPSTTPEAQEYSRRILDQTMKNPYAKEQQTLFTGLEKNAEEARAALRAAREKLIARRFNPADRWYALAAALGTPTETGAKAESIANAARALQGSDTRRDTFNDQRDKDVLGYDERIAALQNSLLTQRLLAGQTGRKADVDLAKEALKTLGRRTGQNGAKGPQAVDRAYAKDYIDWIQNGEPEASQALGELTGSLNQLRGYSVGPEGVKIPNRGGKSDALTGPIVGSIATIPGVGKWMQDVFMPKSANTQEQIESTVQRSLRPILGAQFTEKEGERLISRVYNPRLEEGVNAKRVGLLIDKLQAAYRNKQEAAQFFRTHGTLTGFTPKHRFTINDFMPDATWPGESGYHEPKEMSENPDDDAPAIDPATGQPPPEDAGPAASTPQPGRRVKYEDLPKRKPKPYGFMGFAEGGDVQIPDGKILVQMPDGSSVLADANSSQEDLDALGEPGVGTDSSLGRALFGATAGLTAGYGAAKAGMRGATGLADLLPGRKETPAEARLLRLMERYNTPPSAVTAGVRRNQRRGIPSMAMDTGPEGFRSIAETALPQGGDETQEMLDRLTARQSGARSRVNDQVNRALKPDDYFSKEKELQTKLYGDRESKTPSESSPFYEAAEKQFPSVNSKVLPQLLDTPSGKKAVDAARKTMKDKGVPIGKVNPVTGAVTKYSLQFLNQVKIELDDMINKAEVKGASAKSRAIKDLRTQFRNELDAATTDAATGKSPYQEARGVYETGKGNLDTLQAGRTEFGSMQPEQVAARVNGMTFEQKDLYRTGVAQSLYETLNKPSTDINAAQRLVGSPEMKAKLAPLFDNPNEFRVFMEALQKEADMFNQSKPLLEQKSMINRRAVEPRGNVVQRGAAKAPTLGVFSPTQWALRWLRSKPEISDKDAQEVIRMLRSSTPDELAQFEKMGSKFGRAASRKKMRGRVGMVGAGIGALAGSLLGSGDDEATADEEDPTLKGLTDEEKQWAKTPAKARGGRAFAEGGKVGMIKEMLEALKREVDPAYATHIARNMEQRSGLSPQQAEQLLTGANAAPAVERRAAPRPPPTVSLDLLRQQIAAQQQRYKAIHERLNTMDPRMVDMGDRQLPQPQLNYTPAERERLNQSDLTTQTAMDRMTQNPTPQGLAQIDELLRGLEGQLKRKRGGRIAMGDGGKVSKMMQALAIMKKYAAARNLPAEEFANVDRLIGEHATETGQHPDATVQEFLDHVAKLNKDSSHAAGGRIRRQFGGMTNHG